MFILNKYNEWRFANVPRMIRKHYISIYVSLLVYAIIVLEEATREKPGP